MSTAFKPNVLFFRKCKHVQTYLNISFKLLKLFKMLFLAENAPLPSEKGLHSLHACLATTHRSTIPVLKSEV